MIKSKVNGLVLETSAYAMEAVLLGNGKFAETLGKDKPTVGKAEVKKKEPVKTTKKEVEIEKL